MAEDKKIKKKRLGRILITVLAVFAVAALIAVIITVIRSQSQDFGDRLEKIDGISSVRRIQQTEPVFKEKYLVTFTRPLDPADPSKGTFEQRVEIGYQGDDRVNVYKVSGYCLGDILSKDETAFGKDDREELPQMYDGNFIWIEYRFFGESVPEGFSRDGTDMWEYLTSENATADFHFIIEKLSTVLKGKRIFTGASKGGYTVNAMAHYYPDDCDAYVSYVAPFCEGTEDPRFIRNLYESIGDTGYSKEEAEAMRRTILDFEIYCIENRDELQDMFYDAAIKNGSRFRDTMTREILWDMAVLEFGINCWQYGTDFEAIDDMLAMSEGTEKDHKAKLENVCDIVTEKAPGDNWSIDFFAFPYYWQALTEMGSYKYDYSYLRQAVIEKTGKDMLAITEDMEEGLLARLVFTEDQREVLRYDGGFHREMEEWSKVTDAHLIMVYGGCDTWYSVRIPESGNGNVHAYVSDKGNHRTRINGLDEEDSRECRALLDSWMGK